MEQKMKLQLLRPAIICFLLFLALIFAVGVTVAQNVDENEKTGIEKEIPSQFGSNGDGNTTAEDEAENTKAMIAIGAALAVGISGIGAATGIGIAGASGIGAVAEKPDRFGKSLVLQAMPMTQGIYGLLTAILLLMFGGLLGGGGVATETLAKPFVGLSAVAIGLVVGLAGISAIGQGITASASIGGAARNPDVFSKGMIFTVMSETLAIFGLLTAILIMVGVGLLG